MPRSLDAKVTVIKKPRGSGGARDVVFATEDTDAIPERLRVNNFDLLRLVFATMVVIYHMGILSQAGELAFMRDWVSGSFGLQGFFVVSGFLVSMSYERSRSLQSYALKRARRIAPAYITVVLGAAILFVALSVLDWASYFTDPRWRSYVFWNLLLANFVSPDLPGVFQDNAKQAVNGSLWTIKIEVAFYCMLPVVAWLSRRLGVWRVLVALFVAALAWRIGFEIVGQATGSSFWSKLAIQAPGQFSYFIVGAIAYERTRLGLAPPPMWMALIAAAAYAASSGLLHELVAPVAVGMFVYWSAIGAPFLGHASRYGDFSYGIYLYHWPVIQTVAAMGLFGRSAPVAVLVSSVTVVVLAVSSWFIVERRFLTRAAASRSPADVAVRPVRD